MSKFATRSFFITLALCGVVVFLTVFGKGLFFNRVLPVNSTPKKLSLTVYKWFHPNKPVIILRHYINGLHICDYTLSIENGVHVFEPQVYDLPELVEGTVEIIVELGDNAYVKSGNKANSNFTIYCTNASDLYRKGLLVYLTPIDSEIYFSVENIGFYNRYVYFVSGDNKICYFNSACNPEWSIIMNAPPLIRISPREDPSGSMYWPSGWEANVWVVSQ